MAINNGTQGMQAIYKGANQLSAVYKGDTKIRPMGGSPSEIEITAVITEANQTVRVNKYFTNAHTIDWGDGSGKSNHTSDTTHTYSTAGGYIITLSLAGTAKRWGFSSASETLVPKTGTTASNVYVSVMPSLAGYFGASATAPGYYFFSKFNQNGALTSLPAGSFKTENITTAAGFFFFSFNDGGTLTSLPEGSFNTNLIRTFQTNSFVGFNRNGALTSLPEGSFRMTSNKTLSQYAFSSFNREGSLESLPEGSFGFTKVTYVGISVLQGFNYNGNITNLPESFVFPQMLNPSNPIASSAFKNAFNSPNYTLNRSCEDIVGNCPTPANDRDTFSNNQPRACRLNDNWLVDPMECPTPGYDPLVFTIDSRVNGTSYSATNKEVAQTTIFGGAKVPIEIDWGDGSTDTVAKGVSSIPGHTYATAGEYQITITPQREADKTKGHGWLDNISLNGRKTATGTPNTSGNYLWNKLVSIDVSLPLYSMARSLSNTGLLTLDTYTNQVSHFLSYSRANTGFKDGIVFGEDRDDVLTVGPNAFRQWFNIGTNTSQRDSSTGYRTIGDRFLPVNIETVGTGFAYDMYRRERIKPVFTATNEAGLFNNLLTVSNDFMYNTFNCAKFSEKLNLAWLEMPKLTEVSSGFMMGTFRYIGIGSSTSNMTTQNISGFTLGSSVKDGVLDKGAAYLFSGAHLNVEGDISILPKLFATGSTVTTCANMGTHMFGSALSSILGSLYTNGTIKIFDESTGSMAPTGTYSQALSRAFASITTQPTFLADTEFKFPCFGQMTYNPAIGYGMFDGMKGTGNTKIEFDIGLFDKRVDVYGSVPATATDFSIFLTRNTVFTNPPSYTDVPNTWMH